MSDSFVIIGDNRIPREEGATPEDIRASLLPYFPDLDRAQYVEDQETGNVTFFQQSGSKAA